MLPEATDPTKIVELMEPIPTENFSFHCFFADVFGDVCDIKTTYNDETHAIQRVVVTVLIDRSAFLESYLGMHFYFDNECIAGKSLSSNSTSSYLGVQTIESVAFAELKNYVLNSPPQKVSFDELSTFFPLEETCDLGESPLNMESSIPTYHHCKQFREHHETDWGDFKSCKYKIKLTG
ncbi:hypothetical protein DY000_02060355 [Brassica cretica]|uniref:Uncharacterized protein n=1 Tax=Brassica cretica TaxID=69181 RepID=A0ABQ7AVH3_BRACR|nr:hypothetical protein DY000_02060355 [Brassica cretica]